MSNLRYGDNFLFDKFTSENVYEFRELVRSLPMVTDNNLETLVDFYRSSTKKVIERYRKNTAYDSKSDNDSTTVRIKIPQDEAGLEMINQILLVINQANTQKEIEDTKKHQQWVEESKTMKEQFHEKRNIIENNNIELPDNGDINDKN